MGTDDLRHLVKEGQHEPPLVWNRIRGWTAATHPQWAHAHAVELLTAAENALRLPDVEAERDRFREAVRQLCGGIEDELDPRHGAPTEYLSGAGVQAAADTAVGAWPESTEGDGEPASLTADT